MTPFFPFVILENNLIVDNFKGLNMNDIDKIEDYRPWGYYVILADEPTHKVKRIVVKPGKRLSLQRHQKRAEHWHIISGEALVTLDNQQLNLQAGQAVDIPRGACSPSGRKSRLK